MERERVNFDEARRLHMERMFRKAGIGPDGLPIGELSRSTLLSPETNAEGYVVKQTRKRSLHFRESFPFLLSIVSNLCISTFHVRRTTASSALNFDEYLLTSSYSLGRSRTLLQAPRISPVETLSQDWSYRLPSLLTLRGS